MSGTKIPESRPEAVMSKEEIAIHIQRSRTDRYIRTAHFVQSKWFMIGASAAIVIFLIITYLIAKG